MRRARFFRSYVLLTIVLLLGARSAQATWSIVLADSVTGEVAVGVVTCLQGDLLISCPVVLVGFGAASVQAGGDSNGSRRQVIRNELIKGTPPQEIIEILAGIGGHQKRQYGIVDTQGGAATFTGKSPRDWAGGVIGMKGTMAYAIQGNMLAGNCVVPAIESALRSDNNHDIPAKLMAAMEAAREMGGDGRCSCGMGRISCGCPPPNFDKSGHIGCMLIARRGDIDDEFCDADGCADGDYFMKFNVAGLNMDTQPDPVHQFSSMFNEWRNNLIGRPDAVKSIVNITPINSSEFNMMIELKDWQEHSGLLLPYTLTVEHELDSAKISAISGPVSIGTDLFSVILEPGEGTGIDRFCITASYESGSGEIVSVILMPSPELYISTDADNDGYYAPPAGLDCDDTDPDVNPGANEVCDDGIDNDCDDLIDTADPDCPNGLPAPPSGLTAKARGKSKIALIWQDNSDNEDGFNIYRGTSPSTFLLIRTVGANTTSYVDSGLGSKTTYWYKVCAYNPLGDNCSDIDSTTTK